MINLEIQKIEHKQIQFVNHLEKVFFHTAGMLSDIDTVLVAKEAGLLSATGAKAFAKRVDDFSNIMGLDLASQEAGLESYSGNLEAGLESIMDSIKKGIQTIYAWIEKAIANIAKFFKDIYTKIQTGTKGIEKKLEAIKSKLNSSESIIEIDSSAYRNFIENSCVAINLAQLINDGANKPKVVFDVLGKIIECMSDSKLPSLDEDSNGTLKFKFSNLPYTEQYFVEILKKDKERNKIWDIFNKKIEQRLADADAGIGDFQDRVVSINAKNIEIARFTDDGRALRTYKNKLEFTLPSALKNFIDVLNIDKSILETLSNQISEGIKSIPKLREENNKKIEQLKKFSNQTLKKFDTESGYDEFKDGQYKKDLENFTEEFANKQRENRNKMRDRFDKLSKELMSIWKMYPDISNSTIVNLYFNINRTTNFLEQILKIK